MLAQNKDIGLTLPQLFLACPPRQRYFNFPSQWEKECTSIHFFIPKYSPGLKLSPSDLLKNLMILVRFLLEGLLPTEITLSAQARVGCISKASCIVETWVMADDATLIRPTLAVKTRRKVF
jgi:hypothetical protein